MDWHVLTRQELFDLVWSVPMRTLAQRYGITDVALAKRCKRHAIPKPGVGYWAKVAAGQKARRPPLPKSASSHLERIVFKPAAPLKPPVPRDQVPHIGMPDRLVDPHEVTLWARQCLKEASKDAYGRLEVGGRYHPDLCVQPQSITRALLLLDTVVKALVLRGLEVAVTPYHPKSASALIIQSGGERLVLQVEERLTKMPHVVTPAEQKAAAQPWGRKPQKWDYVPDGRLSVRLHHTHYLFRGRAHWTETKKTPLEQQIGTIVLGIEAAVNGHKDARAEEERQKAERLAEQRRQLRGDRLQWYERWMAQDLENLAADWVRARQLREFLSAYESVKKPVAAAAEWLQAAHHYADALDPLTNGTPVARQLEPSDEVLEQLIEEERQRQTRVPGRELAEYGVRVSAVARPSVVRSELAVQTGKAGATLEPMTE